jgi:ubiquinone/menaquinone biosynthesis C-methylase UbiE
MQGHLIILSKIHNQSKEIITQCIMETSVTHNISPLETTNIIMEYSRDLHSNNIVTPKTLIPLIGGPVVYNTHSIQIAKKITKDTTNRGLNAMLINYQGKYQDKRWQINKKTTIHQYEKFLRIIKENFPNGVNYYIDLGCGDGHALNVLAEALHAQHGICCDVEDVRTIKDNTFMLIQPNKTLQFKDASVDVVSIFHTLHHMEDAVFRLKDVARILKIGGLILMKDHDVTNHIDAENVSFEHYVYSLGEGKAKFKSQDEQNYGKIEPMYYYSEKQVSEYIDSLGFQKIFVEKYGNLTKVYNTIYKKVK